MAKVFIDHRVKNLRLRWKNSINISLGCNHHIDDTYAIRLNRTQIRYFKMYVTLNKVGTLGMHKGIQLDHVMLYMNCDENLLFKGKINRPVLNPVREFVIEHVDKAEVYRTRMPPCG